MAQHFLLASALLILVACAPAAPEPGPAGAPARVAGITALLPSSFLNLGWSVGGSVGSKAVGSHVASAGDVNGDGYDDVVVSDNTYTSGQISEGITQVYLGSAAGLPSTPDWAFETDQANSGSFGAPAGDVNDDGYDDLLVAATGYDDGLTDQGKVFLFLGSAAGLGTTAAWTASSDQASTFFGYWLSTAGDVNGDGYDDVVVGASYYDNPESNEGRVLVYYGAASGLEPNAAWATESNETSSQFGQYLAGLGDVDADGYDDIAIVSSTKTRIFFGSASGLTAVPGWETRFTGTVTSGDVNGDGYVDLVIGDNVHWDGQLFVYHGSPSGLPSSTAWTEFLNEDLYSTPPAVAVVDVNGDGFDDLLAGMKFDGESGEGLAYLFLGSASGLEHTPRWTGQPDDANADFGVSVAAAGDVDGDGLTDVVVGAPRYDISGAAFVYLGGCIGNSGDSDGDGVEDACDVCPGDDDRLYNVDNDAACAEPIGDDCDDTDPASYPGATEICDGKDNACAGALPADDIDADGDGRPVCDGDLDDGAPVVALHWSVSGQYTLSGLGWTVASAGDVNADGYSDVIVGALYFTADDPIGQGALYLGSATGLSNVPAWTAASVPSNAVASAGDVNADGYSDVVVGATALDEAYVYLGSEAGLPALPSTVIPAPEWGSSFGTSVAGAGDVNGDGFDDVVVGAPDASNGQITEGMAYVFLGSAAGVTTTPAWSAESNEEDAAFGVSVASAGDVNADGFADIIVGAWHYDFFRGQATVYLGSASGLGASAWVSPPPAASNAFIGGSVASAGDVNGDGFDDILIGGDNDAFLYLGSSTGPDASAAWTLDSDLLVGAPIEVASAGDVNGDGYDDVLVGVDQYDNGEFNEGVVYLYLGSSAGLDPNAAWSEDGDRHAAFLGSSVASAGDVNGDAYDDIVVGAHNHGQVGRAAVYLSTGAGADSDGDGVIDRIDVCPGLPDAAYDVDGDGVCAVDEQGGVLDCVDTDPATYPGAPEICDGVDNACAGALPADEQDLDADGARPCGGDCDDTDGTRFGGAPERCDGLDNSCAGTLPADELDLDGDGAYACADCDDADPGVHPGASEQCDGLDNNCDASLPADEVDADGDGFLACEECDDTQRARFPGAPERCNGVDDTCAGSLPVEERDADGDGYIACDECDDGDPNTYWGAPERCDGIDNSCAGVVPADEEDLDGDGLLACADCDDTDAAAGGAEVCGDGLDNNCDGEIDEECRSGGCTVTGSVASSTFAAVVLAALARVRRRRVGAAVAVAAVAVAVAAACQPAEGPVTQPLAPPAPIAFGASHRAVVSLDETLEPAGGGGSFGTAAASAGDVDGDGYDDVIVGAPYEIGALGGRASVFLGTATGISATANWTATGAQESAAFGKAVAGVGDVNGDGFDDVVIGSPSYDNGQANEGRAVLYFGSAAGLQSTASWSVESNQISGSLGEIVAPAGDVDGDGYADVLVGAPLYDGPSQDEGVLYLYLGSSTGLGATPAWSVESDISMARFPHSVAAGDVNGDGYDDIIAGLDDAKIGLDAVGAAFVYLGAALGPSATPDVILYGEHHVAGLGVGVAVPGDVNGDGYDDLLVTQSEGLAHENAGAAFLFLGSVNGLGPTGERRTPPGSARRQPVTSTATGTPTCFSAGRSGRRRTSARPSGR